VVRGDVVEVEERQARIRARLEANPLLARERWSTKLGAAGVALTLADAAAAERIREQLMAVAADAPLMASSMCEVVVLAIEVFVTVGRLDDAAALVHAPLAGLRSGGGAWMAARAD